MSDRAAIIWVDAQGEQVLQLIVTVSGVSAIRTQLAALSNAGVKETSEGTIATFTPTTAVATYPTVRQTAQLIYRDAAGSLGRLLLPAPVSSIFLSDGVTVDPAAISSLNAAVIGSLLAGSSLPVAAFVGGQLVPAKIGGVQSAQLF